MTVNWDEVIALTGIGSIIFGAIGFIGSLYLSKAIRDNLAPVMFKSDEHEKHLGILDTRVSIVETRLSVKGSH